MGKIRQPKRFSAAFGIDKTKLRQEGVFDPILNADTPLFVDPLLLSKSSTLEFREAYEETYRPFFADILKLLRASRSMDDLPWKAALKRLSFHEIKGTCLGYGSGSISGSGWGTKLTTRLATTAKQIVDLGIDDPDMFMLLGLFEEDIGPDRISDMVTNVIRNNIARFNQSLATEFDLQTKQLKIGDDLTELVENPVLAAGTPVLLLPRDILRDLPIALSWDDVGRAAYESVQIRERVNKNIGEIWKAKTAQEKQEIKDKVLSSKEAAETWLEVMKSIHANAYDFSNDPEGHIRWMELSESISQTYPKTFSSTTNRNQSELNAFVDQVIEQFRFLVEQKGLWREFWHDNKSRDEKTAQRLFFAIAYSYCMSNGSDITPEADTGSGPVDFKFSNGSTVKTLIEVKLSRGQVEHGFSKQLPQYMKSENTTSGVLLVIDVGGLGKKLQRVAQLRSEMLTIGETTPEVKVVDANPKESASNL
jgi:hypothetical protein